MPDSGTFTNAVDMFNNETQILRYHLMTLAPGKWDDIQPIGSEDFAFSTAIIHDLRLRDEVYRLPLHHCGNGVVDDGVFVDAGTLTENWFEQCDYAQQPPKFYDNGTNEDQAWKYENPAFSNSVFLVPEVGYFTCDNICL